MKKINPILLLAGGAVLAHFTSKGNGIFGIGAVKRERLENELGFINQFYKEDDKFFLEKGYYGYNVANNKGGGPFNGSKTANEMINFLQGWYNGLNDAHRLRKTKLNNK